MATYRLSYFWQSADNEGWSENFYWNGSSLTAAQSELDTLFPLLLAIRSNHFKIVDARVSDVSLRGNTLFTSHTVPASGTYAPGGGAVPLEANSAFMVIFTAVLPRFARWFLRGLTSDVLSGREKLVNAVWDAALTAIRNHITGSSYQARHRLTPPPHATYSYSPISSSETTLATARKPGRPFGLLRGRRITPE